MGDDADSDPEETPDREETPDTDGTPDREETPDPDGAESADGTQASDPGPEAGESERATAGAESESTETDGGVATDPVRPLGLPRWVTGAVPLVLLVVIVGGFLAFSPVSDLGNGEPVPELSIDYTTVPDEGTLRLHVTNNGPPVEVTQVQVDDAYYNYDIRSPGKDARLNTRESATIDIPYHWTEGYDYHVTVMTDGPTFSTTMVAVHETTGLNRDVLGTLALVGFLVGVVPIALGMLWFPFMQTMRDRWLHAILAFSAGILGFLVFDAGFETFEVAHQVPSVFAGPLIAVLGIGGALLLVQAAMDYRTGGEPSRLALAYAAALGIGLHNFAEGLAIGGAFAVGRASLGATLIVGFMVHNVTEGPVVVAPLADGERPALSHFAAIGLLAGAPAIVGGWIGNVFRSPMVTTLFLAVGVGALLQVVFDIGGMIRREGELRSATNLVAFFVGLVVMYATDLLVAI